MLIRVSFFISQRVVRSIPIEHQIADITQLRETAMQEVVPGLPSPITTDPDDTSAQKMETVRNLISEDPHRVAQVVKHWVNEGGE